MTTQKFSIKLPNRTGVVEIIEEPKRIVVKLRFSKCGDFGDVEKIKDWLRPIFEKYDTDERPLVMDNPTTGEVATVFDGVVFVRRCNS